MYNLWGGRKSFGMGVCVHIGLAMAIAGCGGSHSATRSESTASSVQAGAGESAVRVPLSESEKEWIIGLATQLRSQQQPEPSEVLKAAKRIADAPGILVPLCINVMAPLGDDKVTIDFYSIVLVASAAALLQSPELAEDLPTMTVRALTAAVHAYRSAKDNSGNKIASLEQLDSLEQSGTMAAWIRDNWGTCPTTVAMTRAMADVARPNSVIVAPTLGAQPGERPWGAAVPDSAQEKMVGELMKNIAEGKADVGVLAEVLIVGPGLYQTLLEIDEKTGRDSMASIGMPSTSVAPVGKELITREMRTYKNRQDLEALVLAPSFRAVFNILQTGHVRPATEFERQRWYGLIPFEIADIPVTAVEVNGQVAILYFEEGKLFWADLLSASD